MTNDRITTRKHAVAAPDPYPSRVVGALLGTAVGDAIGLPREGMSARRAARLFGGAPLRHRFLFGRGMLSDDAEHACMTAQALLASGGAPARFARSLGWRLRWWLLGLPAGVGWATLKATVKLWLGCRAGPGPAWWPRSGVRSAGNGPAMRAAVIGAYAGSDVNVIVELNRASAEVTHTDSRAREGALVIALAAGHAVATRGDIDAERFLTMARSQIQGEELAAALDRIGPYLAHAADAAQYAMSIGVFDGVTGYINRTVPVALYCWLRWPADFRSAVEAAVLLGGDTDTVAAIVGGLVGATAGEAAIPREWLDGLVDWPRSVTWIRQLATRLADRAEGPQRLFWPALPLRNELFLLIVLFHGFRRLLPPY